MAEPELNGLSATFPSPPPFWKDFTPDKLARIEELRATHAENHDDDEMALRIPDVPDELVNLQPPAEPADGRWRVFGDQYMLHDKLPTLEEQGITNLPETNTNTNPGSEHKDSEYLDRAMELKRLAKSLLLNFLELTGTLAQNPGHAADKVQDLRTIFINVHHILNEYRPHQARESAIALMQDHLDRTRTETMAIREQVDKARRVLEGLGSLSVPEVPEALSLGEEDGREMEAEEGRREREVWAATDAAFT